MCESLCSDMTKVGGLEEPFGTALVSYACVTQLQGLPIPPRSPQAAASSLLSASGQEDLEGNNVTLKLKSSAFVVRGRDHL